jgi:hypothetical protein
MKYILGPHFEYNLSYFSQSFFTSASSTIDLALLAMLADHGIVDFVAAFYAPETSPDTRVFPCGGTDRLQSL